LATGFFLSNPSFHESSKFDVFTSSNPWSQSLHNEN
jgi:hypothetical protein